MLYRWCLRAWAWWSDRCLVLGWVLKLYSFLVRFQNGERNLYAETSAAVCLSVCMLQPIISDERSKSKNTRLTTGLRLIYFCAFYLYIFYNGNTLTDFVIFALLRDFFLLFPEWLCYRPSSHRPVPRARYLRLRLRPAHPTSDEHPDENFLYPLRHCRYGANYLRV